MSDAVGNPPGDAPGGSLGHVTATRRLLRRLRGIMAGSGSAQERLDRIVRVIASEMVAEVCSAYVMRAGEVLELFATEGLRPEAVHRTRLRVGEGLAGLHAVADVDQAPPQVPARPRVDRRVVEGLEGRRQHELPRRGGPR